MLLPPTCIVRSRHLSLDGILSEIRRDFETAEETYVGFRSSGVEMRAASAVDIALWDLSGKAIGRPVHNLLGGLSRPRIRTYNTCAGYTYNKKGAAPVRSALTMLRMRDPTKTRSHLHGTPVRLRKAFLKRASPR